MSVEIHAREVHKTYQDGARRVEVLRGINMDVEAGELLAVVGPSGSGKSTLLHVLGALDRPDRLDRQDRLEPKDTAQNGVVIRIGGQDLAALKPREMAAFRNRTIGFVFQFHQLLPDFTALENVMIPGRIAGREPRSVAQAARNLLEEVGLAERLEHFPNQLSGGERQRVALCRALILEPPLLLADEPTGNLDPESGERVFELLLKLREQRGTTVVLVTHNPALAKRCARIMQLDSGVLHAFPPP